MKKAKRNLKKKAKIIFSVIVLIGGVKLCYKIVKQPEIYITTQAYQLKLDILDGDEEAINYYCSHYPKDELNLRKYIY